MTIAMSPRGETPGDRCAVAPAGLSPAALEILVANRARFLAFLERRVRRRDLAEEILQDAFVRGIARGGSLREDESAIAWFYRLLRHAMIDRARADAADERRRAPLDIDNLPADDGEPDHELIATICACVSSLIATLRPDYAEVIRRVDLGGEPLARFASAVGITPGNAAVRAYRARQALRRRIEESCGTCATHGGYACECRDEPHPGRPCQPL